MSGADAQLQIPEEDQLRANLYSLLGTLLARAPDSETLKRVGSLSGDDSEFGQAIRALAQAARATDAQKLEDEYFNLFIGVGQGELVPYGSYYLTGFLHEKPLARLRLDMKDLGIARIDDVKEPEDHIAAECEMMAGLITGAFGGQPDQAAEGGADIETQKKFFDTHVGCWAPRFFEDLEAAPSAAFYMPVGTIGRLFMAIEREAFELAA